MPCKVPNIKKPDEGQNFKTKLCMAKVILGKHNLNVKVMICHGLWINTQYTWRKTLNVHTANTDT